jgi:hypothetical protein
MLGNRSAIGLFFGPSNSDTTYQESIVDTLFENDDFENPPKPVNMHNDLIFDDKGAISENFLDFIVETALYHKQIDTMRLSQSNNFVTSVLRLIRLIDLYEKPNENIAILKEIYAGFIFYQYHDKILKTSCNPEAADDLDEHWNVINDTMSDGLGNTCLNMKNKLTKSNYEEFKIGINQYMNNVYPKAFNNANADGNIIFNTATLPWAANRKNTGIHILTLFNKKLKYNNVRIDAKNASSPFKQCATAIEQLFNEIQLTYVKYKVDNLYDSTNTDYEVLEFFINTLHDAYLNPKEVIYGAALPPGPPSGLPPGPPSGLPPGPPPGLPPRPPSGLPPGPPPGLPPRPPSGPPPGSITHSAFEAYAKNAKLIIDLKSNLLNILNLWYTLRMSSGGDVGKKDDDINSIIEALTMSGGKSPAEILIEQTRISLEFIDRSDLEEYANQYEFYIGLNTILHKIFANSRYFPANNITKDKGNVTMVPALPLIFPNSLDLGFVPNNTEYTRGGYIVAAVGEMVTKIDDSSIDDMFASANPVNGISPAKMAAALKNFGDMDKLFPPKKNAALLTTKALTLASGGGLNKQIGGSFSVQSETMDYVIQVATNMTNFLFNLDKIVPTENLTFQNDILTNVFSNWKNLDRRTKKFFGEEKNKGFMNILLMNPHQTSKYDNYVNPNNFDISMNTKCRLNLTKSADDKFIKFAAFLPILQSPCNYIGKITSYNFDSSEYNSMPVRISSCNFFEKLYMMIYCPELYDVGSGDVFNESKANNMLFKDVDYITIKCDNKTYIIPADYNIYINDIKNKKPKHSHKISLKQNNKFSHLPQNLTGGNLSNNFAFSMIDGRYMNMKGGTHPRCGKIENTFCRDVFEAIMSDKKLTDIETSLNDIKKIDPQFTSFYNNLNSITHDAFRAIVEDYQLPYKEVFSKKWKGNVRELYSFDMFIKHIKDNNSKLQAVSDLKPTGNPATVPQPSTYPLFKDIMQHIITYINDNAEILNESLSFIKTKTRSDYGTKLNVDERIDPFKEQQCMSDDLLKFRRYNKTTQLLATSPLDVTQLGITVNVMPGGATQQGGFLNLRYPDTPTNCDIPVMGHGFLKRVFDKLYENMRNNGKRLKAGDLQRIDGVLNQLKKNEDDLTDLASKIDQVNNLLKLNPDYTTTEFNEADLQSYIDKYKNKLNNTKTLNLTMEGVLMKLVSLPSGQIVYSP